MRFGRAAFGTFGAIGCLALLVVPIIVAFIMFGSEADRGAGDAPLASPIRINGYQLAGTEQEAARAGFRDCQQGFCFRPASSLLGVGGLRASVWLETSENGGDRHYSGIEFSTDEPETVQQVVRAAEGKGWKRCTNGEGRTVLAHDGAMLRVGLRRRSLNLDPITSEACGPGASG